MSKQYFNILYFIILWIYNPEVFQPSFAASSPDILADYYFGSAELRTSDISSCDDVFKVICYNQCGKRYMCENNICQCMDEEHIYHGKTISRTSNNPVPYYYPFEDNKYLIHSNEVVEEVARTAGVLRKGDGNEYKRNEEIPERAALRHHIAHFCPNLGEARKCIRTCMKVGKPAFCGKDHVCYCGHKFSSHDVNKPLNPNDIYAEFRDLYEKYLGPQNNEKERTD